MKECLNIIGLFCNFVGAIFIFFAYSKDKNEYTKDEEDMKPGEKRYSVFIKHPCFLKVGPFLLILGFLFIFLDCLLNKF